MRELRLGLRGSHGLLLERWHSQDSHLTDYKFTIPALPPQFSPACWLGSSLHSPQGHTIDRMLGFRFQEAELQRVQKVRELELVYARAQLELEVSKAQQLAEVEVKKFKQMTEALGPSTIRDLAVAGPEMQVSVWGDVYICWDHT